jgi:hypothetical protein
MQTKLYFTFLLAWISSTVFSQSVVKPYVESVGDRLCYINKIEHTKDYTIISFEHLNNDNGWISLNPSIKIKASDEKEYFFVKAEGIPLNPKHHQFTESEKKHAFKVFFQRVHLNIKRFDVIEVESGSKYDFNFYGVDLTRKRLSDIQVAHHFENDSIEPAEVVSYGQSVVDSVASDGNFDFGNMFKNIYSNTIDSYIKYLKTPGKLNEIAKLNKEYFDALVGVGFTREEAMQLLTANPVIPNMSKK